MAFDPPENPIQVPVSWVGIDEVPIALANQIIVQTSGPGEFIISFGQLAPPALLGSPQEQAEQASEITFVPVKPITRIGMTRTRLNEFIQVMQVQLERHDQAMEGIDPTGGGGVQ